MSKWTLMAFLVGGAAGLLGGFVAWLFVRDPGRKKLRIGITVGVMVVATQLTQTFFVEPAKVDAALNEVEVMRVLQQREPEAYAAVRAEILKGVRKGGKLSLGSEVARQLAPLVPKYIPRASDEALRRYIAAVVATIDQLRRKDPELARKFLFPPAGESVDFQEHLDEPLLLETAAALGQLVETGSGAPPHEDDAQRADQLLQDVVARLRLTRGEDLDLLARASSPDTDTSRLTAVTADLYREILTLPVPDSALVLRKMLSPT